jgi:trimeric autotransporter adhesin
MSKIAERFWVVLLMSVFAPWFGQRPLLADSDICCPADLSNDSEVAAADLAILLGQWGTGATADLNGDGVVGANDLTMLLSAWGQCPSKCRRTRVLGTVLLPSGLPATGAVVVGDLGGTASTDADGQFEFLTDVPSGVTSIDVTAVATIGGTTYIGDRLDVPVVLNGTTEVAPIVLATAGGCVPEWMPTFDWPGLNGAVRTLVVFDDGTGPALFAGGSFNGVGSFGIGAVAKWDGVAWRSVNFSGSTVGNSTVHALAVFDDGNGPKLYAGGDFTFGNASRIARWEGNYWTGVGTGLPSVVYCLAVFDDGDGTRLYAGGGAGIRKWDGTSWVVPGGGVGSSGGGTPPVYAMAAFDDGGGEALFVAGAFDLAGGLPTLGFARLRAGSWSTVGSGVGGVRALTVHDDGTGPALYAGGYFTSIGGVPMNRIARWDGQAWSAVGSGFDNAVFALASCEIAGGSRLVAGGAFTMASGGLATRIAAWNGSVWAPLASTGASADVLAIAQVPSAGSAGGSLYAGSTGSFPTSDGLAMFVARLDGAGWRQMGSGLNGPVKALAVFNDGSGPALYVGGDFWLAGGQQSQSVAKYKDGRWWPVGRGVYGTVNALTTFDDGTGEKLYLGGDFILAFNASGSAVGGASRIACWNGTNWVGMPGLNGAVFSLATHTDAAGHALIAGGSFTTAGGATANRVARWQNGTWQAFGSGADATVRALFSQQTKAGSVLYAGGDFLSIGGIAASRIAGRVGDQWMPLGDGLNNTVRAICGGGSLAPGSIFVGGSFTASGVVSLSRVARWDGGAWSGLGSGIGSGSVSALRIDDSEPGMNLFVGGSFGQAGGISAAHFASWNGSAWEAYPWLGSFSLATPAAVAAIQSWPNSRSGGSGLILGGSLLTERHMYIVELGCPAK